MPSILIIFEVNEDQENNHKNNQANQEVLKSHLIKLGYLDRFFFENKTYILPCSSMWKTDTNPRKSINEITAVAKKLDIKLASAIAVPSTPWAGF